MSQGIANLGTQMYRGAIEMLLQQPGRSLRDFVTQGSYVGIGANPVDQIGAVRATKNRPRNSDTPLIETPTDRRWIYPNDYEYADLIDQQDKIRTLDQVDNGYVQAGQLAILRAQDDQILLAMFANAATGLSGGTSTPFLSGNIVPVGYGAAGPVGLTVAKLRKVRQLLMSAGADLGMDEIHGAITSLDHDNLLGETQIINSDYAGNGKPVLQDGMVQSFLGIRLHVVEFTDPTAYEAAATMGGATRQLPFWLKSGVHFGIWNDLTVRVDERADKSYATQVYCKTTCGATRLQEKKVVQVLCV